MRKNIECIYFIIPNAKYLYGLQNKNAIKIPPKNLQHNPHYVVN